MIKAWGLPFRGKAAGPDGTLWSPTVYRDRGSIFCFPQVSWEIVEVFPSWGKVLQILWEDTLTRQLIIPWVLTFLGLIMPPEYSHLSGKHLINSSRQRCQAALPKLDIRRERLPRAVGPYQHRISAGQRPLLLSASPPPLSFGIGDPVIPIRGTSVFNMSHMEPNPHTSSAPPSQTVPRFSPSPHRASHCFSLPPFRFLEASSREPQQVQWDLSMHMSTNIWSFSLFSRHRARSWG